MEQDLKQNIMIYYQELERRIKLVRIVTEIKYLGKIHLQCDMCDNYGKHTYLENNNMARGLFPEVGYKDLKICENCAKRESSKNNWNNIKRRLND